MAAKRAGVEVAAGIQAPATTQSALFALRAQRTRIHMALFAGRLGGKYTKAGRFEIPCVREAFIREFNRAGVAQYIAFCSLVRIFVRSQLYISTYQQAVEEGIDPGVQTRNGN